MKLLINQMNIELLFTGQQINSVQSATDLADAKFYSNFVKNISFNCLNSKRNWRGLKIMFFQIVIKRYYVNISNYFIFIS